MKSIYSLVAFILFSISAFAVVYNVGPSQTYTNIGDVPWENIAAGDTVFIHWRSTSYHEKWVINAAGTANNPIAVIGVSGPGGQKPVVDGSNATTRLALDYWNEPRGIIKVGGSSTPNNAVATFITIENLEIRSGRPAYTFTGDNSAPGTYAGNCAAVYIETGQNITVKDCEIHDCGNGIFVAASSGNTQDILITGNYIYDNGISGSIFEHNSYTEALGITFEYNRYGPLRTGCLGNNLKDRSAGTVIRYNWIEGANRQLDLVESSYPTLINDSSYYETYAYGNILVEPDSAGNRQILHYGGDNGTTANYRNGTLYFYNNTVISTRTGRTTLARISTNNGTMEVFNNIIYVTSAGSDLSMVDADGTLNLQHNHLPTGWVNCHGTLNGSVNDLGQNINGTAPGFTNFGAQDFTLQSTSVCIDSGMAIHAAHLPMHNVNMEYLVHAGDTTRAVAGALDLGAFEYNPPQSVQELSEAFFSIYPNPAEDQFEILLPLTGKYELKMYDAQVKIVLNQYSTFGGRTMIRCDGLRSGMYLLEITNDQGDRGVRRILVR